jgi:glucosamine--fructose-6-phosphate aminotransferase (isomerizing)
MCGIFGCLLTEGKAAPVIHAALKRLEYRGYDSAGEATIHGGHLYVKKDVGKIDQIHSRLDLDDLPGKIGIGHTRWATHGWPSKENAHPFVDCKDRLAVVHNGIIENFLELREELEKSGHVFKSRTDSEVIPHLIEDFTVKGSSLTEAVRKVSQKLKGSFAIAVISVDEPDKIVCARRESPLVIGIQGRSAYCASDVPAFLPLTNKALFLEENEMALLTTKGVKVFNLKTGEPKRLEISTITWSPEMAKKSGYRHFMLKEIYEQPLSLRNALRTQELYYDLMAATINSSNHLFLVACGTSYHACLAAAYMFSKIAHIDAKSVEASEFIEHYGNILDSNCSVLAVSQSGETADTLTAIRFAKECGASILGITNVMGSTITRLSKVYIGQNSGPEIGVAATKTFTAQLAVLAKLAIKLAEKRGTITPSESRLLKKNLIEIPNVIEKILSEKEDKPKHLAEKYWNKSSVCFLGRGINVATVLEGRLKLLEVAYIPALAYPAGESKHGFIAIVEKGYPVFFVTPGGHAYSKLIGNIMEMKARGADIVALIEKGDKEIKKLADEYIEIQSNIPEMLTPIAYVVPLQLFAYYMAIERGSDPDKPKNLAKSVTVE